MQVSEIEKIHWMSFKRIGDYRRGNKFEDRSIKKIQSGEYIEKQI